MATFVCIFNFQLFNKNLMIYILICPQIYLMYGKEKLRWNSSADNNNNVVQ